MNRWPKKQRWATVVASLLIQMMTINLLYFLYCMNECADTWNKLNNTQNVVEYHSLSILTVIRTALMKEV